MFDCSNPDPHNESFSDHGEHEEANLRGNDSGEGGGGSGGGIGGRMTRLRARGGVRDRPPIIDEDDDDMFSIVPVVARPKRKGGRKPAVERPPKPPKEPVEHHPIDRERDVTQDESSLYYIIRHSKAAIPVL